MKNYAIILASGAGSRFNTEIPKQFTKINNKTIIEYTTEQFNNNSLIDEIIIVITPGFEDFTKTLLSKYQKVKKFIKGGETRKESSFIGISSISEQNANVLIHDCARPFVSEKIITDCISALNEFQAVTVAIPSTDTIIEVENNIIKKIPARKSMMAIQTPQCFKLSLIKEAHELSKNDTNFTDDCGLVLKNNLSEIHIINGEINNFKITYPKDYYLAEALLSSSKNQTT